MSTQELCCKFHMNVGNLSATLDHYKIPRRRKRGPRSPQHHGSWTGGRIVDKHGYILVKCPDHPSKSSAGYVREHRLVMEKHLGRLLKREEVVHHRNGKRDDNRLENLELFSKNSDHLRHELTGRCPKWTPEGRQRILDSVKGPRGPRRRRSQSSGQTLTAHDGAASSESPAPSKAGTPKVRRKPSQTAGTPA